jgi:hypothetical protein
MTETFTMDVPVEHLAKVRDRVARAQARAATLGVPSPSLTVGEERLIPHPLWPDEDRQVLASEVTIEAPEHLGLPGYRLLGRVDRLPDGSPIIARTPGTEEVAIPAIESAGYCDHCQKVRRRNETFLVEGPDGIRQVGRNCLQDFLGASPEALLWWWRWLRDQRSWAEEGLGQGEEWFRLSELLETASQVAAHGGYLGKAKRQELEDARYERAAQAGYTDGSPEPPPPPTTREVVDAILTPPRNARERRDHQALLERYPWDDGAKALMAATQAAVEALNVPTGNEWKDNVALVTSQDYVRPRHVGIAVSAVVLGLQAIEDANPKEPKEEVVSVPLGAVGERLRALRVEVTFIRHFDSQYGTRSLVKMRAEAEQADLLWWASGYIPEDEVGHQWAITGTVKAHEDDRYTRRPVTVVTRAKYEEA